MGRYRVNKDGKPHYVEHQTQPDRQARGEQPAGEWCGPIVGKGGHSREGEIPGRVLCIACGDFCRDISAAMAEHVLRLDRAYEREHVAGDERARNLDKLRRAGVDVAKLPPVQPRAKGRKAKQLHLIGGGR